MGDILISTPYAVAANAFWWASKQGLQGALDQLTAETCADSLRQILLAKPNELLMDRAADSLCLMAKRRGERRAAS